jgi:hypothetical protein
LLAAARAIWEFFAERVVFEPWREGAAAPVEVDVEPAPTRSVTPVEAPEPPAAAQR